MGVDDHLGHPGKGQQNHQIYHPEMGEVDADDKGSSHPGWGNQGQFGYTYPYHVPDPVPKGDTEHHPMVGGYEVFPDPQST